jgi:DNA-directed RNA polymerase subunit RPC12/RpoP
MFRCENCGSGYSAQAASSWTACPRCLAKEKVQFPLTFELGWKRPGREVVDRLAPQARGSREVTPTT